jgi:hypothetical protein
MTLSTDSRDHAGNWGAEDWRQPTISPGDEVLFSECGRIMRNTDYRSHSFRIVKPEYSEVTLCVKHGGGEERIALDYRAGCIRALFEPLPSDDRYFLMHMLLNLAHRTARDAAQATAATYRKAFVDGRLKKRKQPGRDVYKVTIEPAHLLETV